MCQLEPHTIVGKDVTPYGSPDVDGHVDGCGDEYAYSRVSGREGLVNFDLLVSR